MLWGKNRGKWKKLAVAGSQTQDTSGLSRQCSATEPQQPDNHQPSQSSIQMPQLHTWQPLSMCHQNFVRDRPENSLHQEKTHAVPLCEARAHVLLPHKEGQFTSTTDILCISENKKLPLLQRVHYFMTVLFHHLKQNTFHMSLLGLPYYSLERLGMRLPLL